MRTPAKFVPAAVLEAAYRLIYIDFVSIYIYIATLQAAQERADAQAAKEAELLERIQQLEARLVQQPADPPALPKPRKRKWRRSF